MLTSPNGTVVAAGSGGVITDAAGHRWTISSQFAVLKNGRMAGYTGYVAEIAYVSGIVWHENTGGQWYSWNGAGWVFGDNPLPVEPTDQVLTIVEQILATLITTQTTVDEIMSATTAVQADIASMQASLATIATDITGITDMLGNMDTSGLPAEDQANLDSVTQSLATVASQLTALASPAPAPTPAPTPDPNA